jgi:RNase P subunit RPR2
MKKLSKEETKKEVEEFFKNIRKKNPKEIKKIKKLAMSYNIKIKDKRRLFCKKCFSPNIKTLGIKNDFKRIQCESCKNISRYKIK